MKLHALAIPLQSVQPEAVRRRRVGVARKAPFARWGRHRLRSADFPKVTKSMRRSSVALPSRGSSVDQALLQCAGPTIVLRSESSKADVRRGMCNIHPVRR